MDEQERGPDRVEQRLAGQLQRARLGGTKCFTSQVGVAANQGAINRGGLKDAGPGGFYGPRGFRHMGGPPGQQGLYSRPRGTEEARRVRRFSEELTKVSFPGG